MIIICQSVFSFFFFFFFFFLSNFLQLLWQMLETMNIIHVYIKTIIDSVLSFFNMINLIVLIDMIDNIISYVKIMFSRSIDTDQFIHNKTFTNVISIIKSCDCSGKCIWTMHVSCYENHVVFCMLCITLSLLDFF